MSLIRKHGAVLQAWACLDLVDIGLKPHFGVRLKSQLSLRFLSEAVFPSNATHARYATQWT